MSHTPLTRRDYERTIKAIVQSRREVQKLIDATQRDEHFTLGQLGLQMEPPLRRDSFAYPIGTDEQKEMGPCAEDEA